LSALEHRKLLTKRYNVKHQRSMYDDEKEYVEQPGKEQHDGHFHRADVAPCSSARQGFSRQFPLLTTTALMNTSGCHTFRDRESSPPSKKGCLGSR